MNFNDTKRDLVKMKVCEKRCTTANAAIINEHWDCFKFILSLDNDSAVDKYTKLGELDVKYVKLLKELEARTNLADEELINSAIKCSNVELLKFLNDGKYVIGLNNVAVTAAESGQVPVLRWLKTKGVKLSGLVGYAIYSGSLETVKFIIEEGGNIHNSEVVNDAIWFAGIDVFKFVHEQGVKINSFCFQPRYSECVRFAVDVIGLKFIEKDKRNAVKYGRLKVAQIINEVCPEWSDQKIDKLRSWGVPVPKLDSLQQFVSKVPEAIFDWYSIVRDIMQQKGDDENCTAVVRWIFENKIKDDSRDINTQLALGDAFYCGKKLVLYLHSQGLKWDIDCFRGCIRENWTDMLLWITSNGKVIPPDALQWLDSWFDKPPAKSTRWPCFVFCYMHGAVITENFLLNSAQRNDLNSYCFADKRLPKIRWSYEWIECCKILLRYGFFEMFELVVRRFASDKPINEMFEGLIEKMSKRTINVDCSPWFQLDVNLALLIESLAGHYFLRRFLRQALQSKTYKSKVARDLIKEYDNFIKEAHALLPSNIPEDVVRHNIFCYL